MAYEWDETKARTNLARHGVAFEEARTVFDDPFLVEFYDPDHSDSENRYLAVGKSQVGRLLIVAFADRGEAVRLISARELTPSEQKQYEEG